MRRCRDIAWLLSAGTAGDSPAHVRLEVWMHLAMCRHCRAFRQMLMRLTGAARDAVRTTADEAPDELEAVLVRRLIES